MTAIEYFEHQRNKAMISYGQAVMRGAADEELQNISRKIGYYSQAVEALKLDEDYVSVVRCKNCVYWQDNNGGYPHDECRWGKDETPDADDYCSFGERCAE